MKIAYVINSVEGGGAALPIPAIAEVLGRCGAEIRVLALTRRDGRAAKPIEESGLNLSIREGGEKDHIAALRWLTRELIGFKPDIVWTSLTRATLLGQLAAKQLGIPVVSWQHAAYLQPINAWLLRRFRKLSRLWIGDSKSVTDLTARRLHIGAEQLVTWPIFRAEAAAKTAEPLKPGQKIRIGSLGRLHPVKGYDVLIEAVRILESEGLDLPPYEVAIAGDGIERNALYRQAEAAGLKMVKFEGYVAQPASFLSALHLYMQPSRSEGFCVAAHEAMLAGLPVIASAVGELKNSVVQDETGVLVPPADPRALANALADLLSRPRDLGPMGKRGRERILAEFSADRFEAAGRAIYERLCGFVPGRPQEGATGLSRRALHRSK
jgi:glycosyltransferase involved in cell wall biosynthesis